MRKVVFYGVIAVLLLPISYSYGFSTKGEDCSKCHTLSKDEADALLKELDPNIKVMDIMSSSVKGIWEVDIEAGGKKMPVYVDFSKKYLISGAVISIKDKKNLSQDRLAELNKIVLSKADVANIPLDDALVMGDKDAKHKVIVFDDPE